MTLPTLFTPQSARFRAAGCRGAAESHEETVRDFMRMREGLDAHDAAVVDAFIAIQRDYAAHALAMAERYEAIAKGRVVVPDAKQPSLFGGGE